MPQLVSELLQVLQMGRPGVQEMALSAVSSIAAAAEQAFQPYTAQVLPVLQHFMQHPGKEHLLCRCRAVESAGILVSTLGAKDPVIGPHIAPMMQAVLAGYAAADSSEIREYSHTMFGNVARALGEEFAPYLGHVVGLAFTSCRQEDGAEFVGDDSSDSDGDEELCSDGSSDDEGGGRHFNVRTGVMDEKASATAALGCYAEACPHAFMPYAEGCLQVLTTMSQYWHEEARAAAFDSLMKLTLAAHKAFPPAAGEPVVLSEQARLLSEQVLPMLSSCIEDDCSKPAAGAAAAALAQLIKQLGRGAVGPTFLEGAANMAQLLLQDKAACQEVEDDDEDDAVDDEDVAAEEEDLLAAAADLLPALAASMGQDAYAAAFLGLHAEPLLARLRPQQPAALRAIAAGAAAEVAEALGGRVTPVVEPLLTLMLRELQTEVGAWPVFEQGLAHINARHQLSCWASCRCESSACNACARSARVCTRGSCCCGLHTCLCCTVMCVCHAAALWLPAGGHQPSERRLLCWAAGGGQPRKGRPVCDAAAGSIAWHVPA
eukprot:GHRQ01015811.1.p1 GENE.GHRQ01015811.1~~GHRQ01015811.1.p1  ORF type:complete len:546 (+),score=193.28 GHRQ01015811.1:112-1749(+)